MYVHRSLLQALLVPLFALSAFPPTEPRPSAAPDVVKITIGSSVVPLNGPWKFHLGDDPSLG
jgi:hypothetical protein